MAQPSAPPLQDKSALLSHQAQPVNPVPFAPCYPELPPPYTSHDPGPQVAPSPMPQPGALYPNQATPPVMPVPLVQAPVQQSVAPARQAAPVVVVAAAALPPGACTVCRKGKMKNSASFWTWLCCCLLLPVGILPGLFIFCCCCRHPKCTNCGYTP